VNLGKRRTKVPDEGVVKGDPSLIRTDARDKRTYEESVGEVHSWVPTVPDLWDRKRGAKRRRHISKQCLIPIEPRGQFCVPREASDETLVDEIGVYAPAGTQRPNLPKPLLRELLPESGKGNGVIKGPIALGPLRHGDLRRARHTLKALPNGSHLSCGRASADWLDQRAAASSKCLIDNSL
jgi:hypothetical protein